MKRTPKSIPDLTRNPAFPQLQDSCFRRNDGDLKDRLLKEQCASPLSFHLQTARTFQELGLLHANPR
jgi:hypothetical protein